MDYGKGGTTVHLVCMQGCGTEWDEYIPAGHAVTETCEACLKVLCDAFWAIWDEDIWTAYQAALATRAGSLAR